MITNEMAIAYLDITSKQLKAKQLELESLINKDGTPANILREQIGELKYQVEVLNDAINSGKLKARA